MHRTHCHIEYGDSLHRPCHSGVLDILHWILADLGEGFQPPCSILAGEISHQGNGGGKGSCALAALNFVQRKLDNSIPAWSGSTAYRFRDQAMRDLIVYHFLTTQTSNNSEMWFQTTINRSSEYIGLTSDEPTGYPDFNMLVPTVDLGHFS